LLEKGTWNFFGNLFLPIFKGSAHLKERRLTLINAYNLDYKLAFISIPAGKSEIDGKIELVFPNRRRP